MNRSLHQQQSSTQRRVSAKRACARLFDAISSFVCSINPINPATLFAVTSNNALKSRDYWSSLEMGEKTDVRRIAV